MNQETNSLRVTAENLRRFAAAIVADIDAGKYNNYKAQDDAEELSSGDYSLMSALCDVADIPDMTRN